MSRSAGRSLAAALRALLDGTRLEQSLDFLVDDELLEVTPAHLRLRKRYLTEVDQARARRRATTLVTERTA